MQSTVWNISVYSLLTGILIAEHFSKSSAFVQGYVAMAARVGTDLSIIATPRRSLPSDAEVLCGYWELAEEFRVSAAATRALVPAGATS